MDPTERFTELVRRPDADIPLAEAMLLIAAHDHEVEIAAQLARLDALADGAPADAEALAHHLFIELGFLGNEREYTDPRNSYLDAVLDRHLGIPITLSVLMMEIGRRKGLPLVGVGMPGHFLVGASMESFFDPFHGGARLDTDGAKALFAALRGGTPFLEEYLQPIETRPILARVLANLLHAFVDRHPGSAVWAARLRLRIPGLSLAERREVAALLGSLGHFAEAAAELEAIAPAADDDTASRLARDAAALRARAN